MASFYQQIQADGLWWSLFGLLGTIIFQSRFYLQWIASEREKRSVVPTMFWYMSCVGGLMLLIYSVATQSPVGALSFTLNIGIYVRNLVHIWRNEGRLSRRMHTTLHVAVAVITTIAVYYTARVWVHEYHLTKEISTRDAQQTWFWLAIGAVGTGLFGARFLIQWIATEKARASVIPNAFWYFSLVACVLQLACYIQRTEWLLALSTVGGFIIAARNLWFIHQNPNGHADAADTL